MRRRPTKKQLGELKDWRVRFEVVDYRIAGEFPPHHLERGQEAYRVSLEVPWMEPDCLCIGFPFTSKRDAERALEMVIKKPGLTGKDVSDLGAEEIYKRFAECLPW